MFNTSVTSNASVHDKPLMDLESVVQKQYEGISVRRTHNNIHIWRHFLGCM